MSYYFLGDKYGSQDELPLDGKKLLDIVRDKIRFKHYSNKIKKSYIGWIKYYIFYHNKKHPIEMAKLVMNKGMVSSTLDM